MNEMKNEMILIKCYDFKLWGPHAFINVMCIRIFPRYVMLVQMRIFDILVHHDIM